MPRRGRPKGSKKSTTPKDVAPQRHSSRISLLQDQRNERNQQEAALQHLQEQEEAVSEKNQMLQKRREMRQSLKQRKEAAKEGGLSHVCVSMEGVATDHPVVMDLRDAVITPLAPDSLTHLLTSLHQPPTGGNLPTQHVPIMVMPSLAPNNASMHQSLLEGAQVLNLGMLQQQQQQQQQQESLSPHDKQVLHLAEELNQPKLVLNPDFSKAAEDPSKAQVMAQISEVSSTAHLPATDSDAVDDMSHLQLKQEAADEDEMNEGGVPE